MLSLAPPPLVVIGEQAAVTLAGEPGLADVVTFGRQQRAVQAPVDDEEEERFFADTLAEYQWARDVAGLAPSTLARLTRPLTEVCEHYGLVPWRLTPRHVDRYFAGPGKRAGATVRQKLNRIDGYFAFLEQRYGGEIARRFGCAVESPVDPFNRPGAPGRFRAAGAAVAAGAAGVLRRLAGRAAGCAQGTGRLPGLRDGEGRLYHRGPGR